MGECSCKCERFSASGQGEVPKIDGDNPVEDSYPHFRSVLPQRHLVLNMDVNKTVIMSDKVSGKSSKDVIQEALSNVAWGLEKNGTWTLTSTWPSSQRPPKTGDGQEVISYTEFVEKMHPGSKNKKTRQGLTTKFTDQGHPGHHLEKLATMALLELRNPDGSPVGIVPSFFELLLALKRDHRSFTLVFRTFGEDLGDIADEVNAFCEGRHPRYPDARMDGSDGEPDYRFSVTSQESCATFHRDDEATSLVLGTVEQPGEGKYKNAEDKSIGFFKQFENNVSVISGMKKVQAYFRKKYTRNCTLGVRDYFGYWKQKGMTEEGGKPFFFEPIRSTGRHEIFFDDNIHYTNFYIVQPCHMREPRRKHWVVPLLRTHLVRAEPWDAIYDRDYFMKNVLRLEMEYEQKLKSRERLSSLMLGIVRQKNTVQRFEKAAISSKSETDRHYDPWSGLRMNDHMISVPQSVDEEDAHDF